MLEHLFLSDFKINRLILSYHCLKILPPIDMENDVYALELPRDSIGRGYAPFELEVDIYTGEPKPLRAKPIHPFYGGLGKRVGSDREPIFDKIDDVGTEIFNSSNSYIYVHRYPELLEEIRDNIRILQGDRSIADVDNRLSNNIPKMWSYIEECEDLIISLGGKKQFEHLLLTEDMLEGLLV